ncbi:hypothetical protein LAZ67_1006612 [Cordylochernes scorpioides]|uniref:DUF5641 domain-containing protein n=1 Tax=Cordylochernes scorpioides TaxID=51811 RepID=A0ABY6JYR3_9ARAC|nr:hypothetical protein LAZ67_1006612 [Cordylochernes scorpioides]
MHDLDDFNPLTPGHFLIGRPLTALPESNDDDVPINYLDRWSLNQKIKNVFWKRWNREYLNNLQQRLKWQKSSPNIKEDDLILLKDTISPPAMYWSLGRITKVFPGADGKVRVVEMTTELPQIQKFNGDNFHLWKFQMKIILEAKDLLSIIDGSEVKPEIEDIAKFSNWKKKDAKSKMLITTALEFKYLQQIVNCQTSVEMWKKLLTIYELKSETNKYLLQQRFFEYKMNPNDNIATHISKVETLAQQMKDLAWDSVSSEEKTLENLTARLLKEESLQDHWDSSGNSKPDNALMTFSKFKRNSTASNKQQQHQQSIKDKKKNTHCGYCKKKGHWWKECYKRKEEQKGQQPSSSSRDDSCAFSAETSAFLAETKDSWIADSGATDHMTFRREWFSTFEEIPEGVHPVCLGDGKKIYAKEMCPKDDQEIEEMNKIPYRQTIGSLMYLMTGTRPDIAYAVSQFMNNPGPSHWTAVKKIFGYLKATKNIGICFGGSSCTTTLIGFSDAEFAADIFKKALPPERHKRLRSQLGLFETTECSSGSLLVQD